MESFLAGGSMNRQHALGSWGEEYAARWITRTFGPPLLRNWHSAAGEVDVVFKDGSTIVLCEVKTRRNILFGHPSEAIGEQRLDRLRRAAELWVATQGSPRDVVRIDAITIVPGEKDVLLAHFEDVGS